MNWRLTVFRLALMVLLLLAAGCLIVPESIWDAAEDGVSGLSYTVLASVVGIAAAMLLAWALAGWHRLCDDEAATYPGGRRRLIRREADMLIETPVETVLNNEE